MIKLRVGKDFMSGARTKRDEHRLRKVLADGPDGTVHHRKIRRLGMLTAPRAHAERVERVREGSVGHPLGNGLRVGDGTLVVDGRKRTLREIAPAVIPSRGSPPAPSPHRVDAPTGA